MLVVKPVQLQHSSNDALPWEATMPFVCGYCGWTVWYATGDGPPITCMECHRRPATGGQPQAAQRPHCQPQAAQPPHCQPQAARLPILEVSESESSSEDSSLDGYDYDDAEAEEWKRMRILLNFCRSFPPIIFPARKRQPQAPTKRRSEDASAKTPPPRARKRQQQAPRKRQPQVPTKRRSEDASAKTPPEVSESESSSEDASAKTPPPAKTAGKPFLIEGVWVDALGRPTRPRGKKGEGSKLRRREAWAARRVRHVSTSST